MLVVSHVLVKKSRPLYQYPPCPHHHHSSSRASSSALSSVSAPPCWATGSRDDSYSFQPQDQFAVVAVWLLLASSPSKNRCNTFKISLADWNSEVFPFLTGNGHLPGNFQDISLRRHLQLREAYDSLDTANRSLAARHAWHSPSGRTHSTRPPRDWSPEALSPDTLGSRPSSDTPRQNPLPLEELSPSRIEFRPCST